MPTIKEWIMSSPVKRLPYVRGYKRIPANTKIVMLSGATSFLQGAAADARLWCRAPAVERGRLRVNGKHRKRARQVRHSRRLLAADCTFVHDEIVCGRLASAHVSTVAGWDQLFGRMVRDVWW